MPNALTMKTTVPPNGSPEMKEFLENRAALAGNTAPIAFMNQHPTDDPATREAQNLFQAKTTTTDN